MGGSTRPAPLEQFVEDELLRAPLIFDQLLDGVLTHARQQRTLLGPAERVEADDLVRELPGRWAPLAAGYLESLREQLHPTAPARPARRGPLVLELVDEEAIALDLELSRTINAVKDAAEAELRDLQAYLASMVGDMDIADDHNPLHPAVHARALRSAAQAAAWPLKLQCRFIRLATPGFAQLLRQSYAASCARLEEQGVEPATHRTVLLPDGSRRLQLLRDVTYVPDLRRLRDALPATVRRSLSREQLRRLSARESPAGAHESPSAHDAPSTWNAPSTLNAPSTVSAPSTLGAASMFGGPPSLVSLLPPADRAAGAATLADRQAVELVHRLFKAFALDERIPDDVGALIARLRGPALRLTLRDPSVLDRREHPLWSLIHLLAYHAEMVPEPQHPERQRWLARCGQAIDALAGLAVQSAAPYGQAVESLEASVRQRLDERCAVLAPQLEALRRTEAGLAASATGSDGAALDTVPAALLPRGAPPPRSDEQAQAEAQEWLDALVPGQWLRLLLKGRWVHAQLLWAGERRRILLLGDGASDATWALRRPVLLTLHRHGLAKTLQMRALVGAAALRVQEQLSLSDAA